MKKLVLSALLLAAVSQAAGCIIVADDDDTGNASVSWATLTVQGAQPNGATVATNCPAGATHAFVFALPAGAAVNEQPYEDIFDCETKAGTATSLPAGRYTMWVMLADRQKVVRYAESLSELVDVPAGGTASVRQYEIFTDHAFYSVGWRFRTTNGQPAPTCASSPSTPTVGIDVTDSGGLLRDNEVPCTAGENGLEAASDPLPIGGRYTIAIDLLNNQGLSVGSAPDVPPQSAGTVEYGNKYQSLGTVDITLI